KWYCVSRNTTSMPGAAFDATSISTQSWNDAASTTSAPKRLCAHLIAAGAGFTSSSTAAALSSARSMSTSGRSTLVGSRRLMLLRSRRDARGRSGPVRRSAGYLPLDAHSCRGALPVADIRDIRTGLVVVDVELGTDVGRRELVELLQLR